MIAWWHHQIETFSVLPALCAGKPPVTNEFPAHRPVTRALIFSLICAWANSWVNNRNAGDLRRHRAHYDVTVMCTKCEHYLWLPPVQQLWSLQLILWEKKLYIQNATWIDITRTTQYHNHIFIKEIPTTGKMVFASKRSAGAKTFLLPVLRRSSMHYYYDCPGSGHKIFFRLLLKYIKWVNTEAIDEITRWLFMVYPCDISQFTT